ncbi:nucleotidyltransferase domain-containing protein [Legionella sp. km772]|uniref:nucleotidyltransferase domain-containing protein n=1 Tax=Legionella sp. km772 TaxID=2498111 RepID=UPI000F8CE6A0|nr:nucleotidyltransferase domain-containing protein [Legionella sp. km772]RUR10998.1 nucleotidyltransferase domain-containing protein [Legionella sp. km772]
MQEATRDGLPLAAIEKINSIFQQYPQINKVVLYGLRALGNYRNGSDIDLCIDSNSLNLTELFSIETQIDDLLLPWKIDLSLKNSIDNEALLEHILTHGLVFFPHS